MPIWFPLLTIMNNVAINIPAQVFMWTSVFISLVYMLKSDITGSYGSIV